MASLRKDQRSGNWTVYFWHGGKQFCRSCETKSQRGADGIKRRIEEFITRDLKTGRVTVPEGADVGEFIYSGGTRTTRAARKAANGVRLGGICESYTPRIWVLLALDTPLAAPVLPHRVWGPPEQFRHLVGGIPVLGDAWGLTPVK